MRRPKAEAGAHSQIGFAQRGTGCSRFTAGKVKHQLAAEDQLHTQLAALAAELGLLGQHGAADEGLVLKHLRTET